METKANHLAVGTFVLIVLAGVFGFVVWLGKGAIDREFDRYHIFFTGSVSGLTATSTVRYRGVPVGTVSEIGIDPDNSEQVLVLIEIQRGTPIKEDTVASLEFQGITGLVDVEITGGSRNSPPLEPEAGTKIAVIASTPSKLEALFEDVPHALARLTALVERGTLLFSDDNLSAISKTLQNLETVSDSLAANSGDVETLVGDVAITASEVRRTAEEINVLVKDLRVLVPAIADDASATFKATEDLLTSVGENADTLTVEVQKTLQNIRESTAVFTGAAKELTGMISENRPAFRDFSNEGLYEMSRFLAETRDLIASLTRIAEQIEADPGRFLFGDSQAGFEAE